MQPDSLRQLAAEVAPKAAALRWSIHAHPEMANQEIETTNRLAHFFEDEGLVFHRFDGLTGGYVHLRGQGAGKPLCFRADIDALPVTEHTGCQHASQRSGVMHACGHDLHTAIAAGLALALARCRDHLPQDVVVLFQPAEENNPVGGAQPVIEAGLFSRLEVGGILGLHLWPTLPVGSIGVKPGVMMGASDKFLVDVFGRAAHAAEPHKGVDALSIATDLFNALVHKLRREVDPFSTCLVTVGELRSFGRYNILCDHARLEGTIRTVSPETRAAIKRRIVELAEGLAHSYGGRAEVTTADGYGFVDNHPAQTAAFIAAAQKILGDDQVHTDIQTSLIGEDFSAYSRLLPSTYFFLGCESDFPLHNDRFLPDERALAVGISLAAGFLLTDVGAQSALPGRARG